MAKRSMIQRPCRRYKYNIEHMKMTRKTGLNILLILFVLSFFVTPVGHFGKVLLNRIFAKPPTVIVPESRGKITDYDWRLKDGDWNYINFEKSRGKVVLINFWASWNVPSVAQLHDFQKLYDKYGKQMDFYIITDEEREDPEEVIAEGGYTFPITYQIIGEPSPIKLLPPPGSYLLDRQGSIVIHQEAISDWDNDKVYGVLDQLIDER